MFCECVHYDFTIYEAKMAHIFKLNGEYDCSVTDRNELERLCDEVVVDELRENLISSLGSKAENIDIKVSWVYDGYRVFIMDRLTESEVSDFVRSLDPLKQIDTCNLFWEFKENKNCTGILLGYDYTHYLRFLANTSSFIVLANKGLEEFMRKLSLKYALIDPKLELKYKKDKAYERKIIGEKLKGIDHKAIVEIPREKLVGRMHTSNLQSNSKFDAYWKKQAKKGGED